MAALGPQRNPSVRSAPQMVDQYLRRRGIRDERLLEAMARVPRDRFVPEAFRERAFSDHPLPIGSDQTITQPYVVAIMTQELQLSGREKILEVGTGSGYQTAILAELGRSVFSIDRVHRFVAESRKRLESLNYHNISIRAGNGLLGWSEYAPYDRIIVTAAVERLPNSLSEQLAEKGLLIAPIVVEGDQQEIFLFQKKDSQLERRSLGPCAFVPSIG